MRDVWIDLNFEIIMNSLIITKYRFQFLEDCMSATLYLSAPYYDVNTDNNSVFTYDQVIGELSDKGVKMGIDDAMLHKMIEERIYNRNVVIAPGKADGEW